jgi:molecular chaperone HtpG
MARSKSSKEIHEFKADLRQVLEIITHSLYSHREVFLRELISNASDALDKLRFESLTRPELREEAGEPKILISADKDSKTLVVSDNGIGMSRESIVDDLGTIAKSGTRAFLEQLEKAKSADRPELIGQFGVGFYSAFMVAREITVSSRRAGESKGVEWTSRGEGEFTLVDIEKQQAGTEIRLHLRDDAEEYLETHRLMDLVRKYSDFIEHPVVMALTKEVDGKEETVEERLNSGKAIWLRSPKELSESDYAEFYKQIARDFQDPLSTIHYSAEGVIEFKALLFIPQSPPWEQLFGESRGGLSLYIQRVFIMDDCQDLLPPYLRFVRGVVDSADLPLNVSRELLQENALVHKIRKNLTKRVLKSLAEMKSEDRTKYEKFFKRMGPVLKEGITRDFENHDAVAELLLFESTRTQAGETTTLEHYLAGMPEDQEAIWYLIGEDRSQIENAPYLESFKSKGQEVLLLTDPVDEFLVHSLPSYKDKPLRAVDREESKGEEVSELTKESYESVLQYLDSRIEEVSEVRLSSRLRESAACLVAAEGALGSHMERLLEKMGREEELPESKRILELNPEHPAVQALRELYERDSTDARVEAFGRLLYDEAVLAEGSRPKDPAAFARRINELIAASAQGSGGE